MERAYTAYGLRLCADAEIPGLGPRASHDPPDVRVWLGKRPPAAAARLLALWYKSRQANRAGRPNLTIWRSTASGAFHFEYDDRIEFVIAADGRDVWCSWPETASLADAAVYLRGPVLGLVLRLRGVVCLHASAVAVGDFAVAILGSAGAGKSTTAAQFVKMGFPLLSDDVAALSAGGGALHVLPGYPRLNLWPDAGAALYGGAPLPRVAPPVGVNHWWDKRYRDLETGREFHPRPLPLGAVYVLGDREAEDAPRIGSLAGREAFVALTEETYVNYALDEAMRAEEFRTLGRIVRTIPVRLVTRPGGVERLPDACEAILSDFNQVASPPLVGC